MNRSEKLEMASSGAAVGGAAMLAVSAAAVSGIATGVALVAALGLAGVALATGIASRRGERVDRPVAIGRCERESADSAKL